MTTALIALASAFLILLVWRIRRRLHHSEEEKARLAQAKEAAEEINRATVTYLVGISQEIKTPLNMIINWSHQGLKAHDHTLIYEYFDHIEHTGELLIQILEDISDLSKIESGRLILIPKPFSLGTLLDDLNTLYAATARQKMVDFRFNIDERALGAYKADGVRVRQILDNILSNAIKFTHQGSITLSAVLQEHDDLISQVQFAIHDSGIGMDEQTQKEMFLPFAQGQEPFAKSHGSSGLGLAITSRLVHLMGGELKVESQEGKGSTFAFTLPLLRCPDQPECPEVQTMNALKKRFEPQHADNAPTQNTKARILVVDDQPTNARMLAHGLTGEYTVQIATGGAKALEIAHGDTPPDLILLDIMMPEIDGYTTCRSLKSDPKTSRIPIIFVSALDEEREEERGLNLGAVDYITKPFNLPIVRARVRNHINLKRQADLLEAMSHIDPLTHVANRRHFDEKLSSEALRLSRSRKNLGLLMIDIDFFKQFNDHYGHGLGDECLFGVAQALERTLQRPADLLARYGGEEFVAVLPETDEHGVMEIARRMLQAIESLAITHAYSQAADHVTVSIGAVCAKVDSRQKALILLQRADEALYKAKATGRNRVEKIDIED